MDQMQGVIRSAQQLLKKLPDPIYITDLNDRMIWNNDAFQQLYGKGTDLIQHLTISGSIEKVSIQNDANELIGFTVLVKDSVRNGSTDQLALLPDENFRIVAENTSDTIILVDKEIVIRYVSPSIKTLTGYDVDVYKRLNAAEIIHQEDLNRVRSSLEQAVQSKEPMELEYRLIHAKGNVVHIEVRLTPVSNGEGDVEYVVAVARNVTERKKKEELLENILDNVNAAVLSPAKDFTHYTFCSRSIEKIVGLSRDEVMSNPIRVHDHIHPEDNDVLMGEVKRKLDMGMPVEQVVRFIHVPDEIRWAKFFIHPHLDQAGVVERFDSILLDITEKKRSEMALEESEQRYKSLFENNLDGVFSIELNGFYFVNANRSFERITGIQLEKLPDRCFMGLIVDEDHPLVYEAIFHVMKTREPRDIECRITRSEHGEKIVSITFVPIFLSGELIGIHGIVKDITQRKKEERELIQSEERYKTLQQSLNRFSHDLVNVMKVSELENRLMEEVKSVFPVTSVSIEEIPREQEHGLMNTSERWIKIAEKQNPVYLRIAMDHVMLKIEEEWLETACHYVTILYDNLHLIEDLMKRLEDMVTKNVTPKWMLKLLFKLSEKERASLSSDLHDSVLQDLIIWYRKLESLRSSAAFAKETQDELEQIEEGLLDAIHQLRITCNELRPPFLLKMGLVESLKSLFSYTLMFSNYEIDFLTEQFNCSLNEDQILGLYRIVQELLNNATKHSQANKVTISLACKEDHMYFTYSDDGVGMDLSAFEGSFQHMGITGIEKRVLSLEGEVKLKSALQEGLQVNISIPLHTQR
ncbi:sensor histidine kinase [Brevibacillus migulae]|uniref:sensor histidine kinase n=1 Tax=Brevibacillus migulae TaxID=1644114 RepID=UPI001F444720|nr:PAS domain S-box protein [Brevibacillus migulae]